MYYVLYCDECQTQSLSLQKESCPNCLEFIDEIRLADVGDLIHFWSERLDSLGKDDTLPLILYDVILQNKVSERKIYSIIEDMYTEELNNE